MTAAPFLRSIVAVRSSVPEDAFTAEALGTVREGSGVVIRENGLVLTIGYLITEAEEIWLTDHAGRVVPAHALAYDASGKILAVGETDELLARYPQARRLDVGKATVVPGLIDAHAHVGGLGFAMMGADLVGTRDKAEVFARLKAKAAGLKPGEWLLGSGWDQNDWPEKAFPSAAELDAQFPDRPVWLSRIDGHAGWANSAAMRAVPRDLSSWVHAWFGRGLSTDPARLRRRRTVHRPGRRMLQWRFRIRNAHGARACPGVRPGVGRHLG